MMEESVTTFETHLTAVMDSLIRASVCEITKLFQETVNDYLVELSLNRKENEALKLRLRLTENKLRTERKYGMGWAANRRNAGLAAAEEEGAGGRQKRKVEMTRMVEDEAGEGSLSGEGEETANIKEEVRETGFLRGGGFPETEGYQPASLRLIKEALKMGSSNQKLHAGSRAQSDGELSDHPPTLHPGDRAEEDWEVDSTEPSEGGMTMDELRGLESALRAERGREQATMTASQPVSPDSKAVQGSEISLAPKYIGLDGMEQDEELEPQPPTLHREDHIGQGIVKDSVRVGAAGGGELRLGWSKKLREGDSGTVMTEEDGMEQGDTEPLPHLSAPGSVGESGGEEEGVGDLLHFCPQCGGGFTSEAELEEHPCPLGGAHLQSSGAEDSLFPWPRVGACPLRHNVCKGKGGLAVLFCLLVHAGIKMAFGEVGVLVVQTLCLTLNHILVHR
ncbi:hypothetical protein INR49_024449, partial [Caranx melampygus]